MIEFNDDGSLKIPSKRKKQDHITVMQHINELPFPIGKKLLIQSLRGDLNSRTKKLRFDKLIYFGAMGGFTEEELDKFINFLIRNNYLEVEKQKGIYQVLTISKKGFLELDERIEAISLNEVISDSDIDSINHKLQKPDYEVEPITTKDKQLFESLAFFLDRFTDEQKKAIICSRERQLCIAGAGSGKTAVLTNKIAYLVKFKSIDPERILAITFTRKAKQELEERLSSLIPNKKIYVETFNSFAEKELLRYGEKIYGIKKRMVSNSEFNKIIIQGLNSIGYSLDMFLQHYFSARERRGKEQRQLFYSFMYDFRAILDAFIEEGGDVAFFEKKISSAKLSEQITARTLIKLAKIVHDELKKKGLRTYTDQLIDVNKLYEQHTDIIPSFDFLKKK